MGHGVRRGESSPARWMHRLGARPSTSIALRGGPLRERPVVVRNQLRRCQRLLRFPVLLGSVRRLHRGSIGPVLPVEFSRDSSPSTPRLERLPISKKPHNRVPTWRTWGHRHHKARLRPGFFGPRIAQRLLRAWGLMPVASTRRTAYLLRDGRWFPSSDHSRLSADALCVFRCGQRPKRHDED